MFLRAFLMYTHTLKRTTIRKRSPLRLSTFRKEVLAQAAMIWVRIPEMQPISSVLLQTLSPSKVRQMSISHMACLTRQSLRPSPVTRKLSITVFYQCLWITAHGIHLWTLIRSRFCNKTYSIETSNSIGWLIDSLRVLPNTRQSMMGLMLVSPSQFLSRSPHSIIQDSVPKVIKLREIKDHDQTSILPIPAPNFNMDLFRWDRTYHSSIKTEAEPPNIPCNSEYTSRLAHLMRGNILL